MGTEAQPGKIACPHCQALIKAPALPAGSPVNCPKCGQPFRLGQAAAVQSPKPKVQGQESGVRGQETGVRSQRTDASRPQRAVPQPPPPPPSTKQLTAGASAPSTQYSAPTTPASADAPRLPSAAIPQSAIRNPHSSKPDNLVDPNLLAPPPPRQKPKPKEVAVVCHLCGTRAYAPLEKIGQEIKCPDCHTRNVVPPLPMEVAAKSRGPSLDDAEDFQMSEVVERPKYRPLVASRGEYETLSALDPAAVEHRLTVPGQRPRRSAAEQEHAEHAEGDEIALAPAVEVVEAARDPRTVLPQPELEPEDPLYDGRYDDGLIGDGVSPRSPDAWKKAPFLYGLLEFLFFPSTLLRVVSYSVGLTAVGALVRAVIVKLIDGEAPMFLLWMGIPLTAVWLFAFAVTIHAIIVATGNGENEIESWPDWNVFDWFGPAMYTGAAMVASLLPGGAIGGVMFTMNLEDPMMDAFAIGLPPVLSGLILFPLVLHSMLAEDHPMAFLSPAVMRTWQSAGDAWMIFYMYSIGIAFLLTGGLALFIPGQMAMTAVGACATVAVLLLYARLLGRLMWYTSQRDAQLAAPRRNAATS
jgi:hypothetical protein